MQQTVETPPTSGPRRRVGIGWYAKMTLAIFLGVMAVSVVALYILLSPPIAMSALYNRMIFIPSKDPLCPTPKTMQSCAVRDVYFKSKNGTLLHALYVPNPKATKTVLLSHGNGGNVSYFLPTIDACLAAGASVFIYDYQGFGQSQGTSSLETVVEDGLAAYDYVVEKLGIKPENVALVGQSLGSGVSCQIAAHRPASAIVLLSAYTSILKAGREHVPFLNLYPDLLFPKQTLDAEAVLSKPHAKTLIVHGALDTTLSLAMSQTLKAKAVGDTELMVLPKAGHNDIFNVNGPEVVSAIQRILK